MLAAVGATEKHLRLVMVASGAVTGAVAAVLGSDHRRGRLDRPRAPGRTRRRLPDRRASTCRGGWSSPAWLLAVRRRRPARRGGRPGRWPASRPCWPCRAGRPDRRRPIAPRRWPRLFVVGGVVCLALAGDVADDTATSRELDQRAARRRRARWPPSSACCSSARWRSGRWPGSRATAARRVAAGAARPRPLPGPLRRRPRRDQPRPRDPRRHRRHRGRRRAHRRQPATCPTVNCWCRPVRHRRRRSCPSRPTSPNLQAGVDRLVAALDDPTVIPLDVAVDPDLDPDRRARRAPRDLARPNRSGDGWSDVSPLYVATPDAARPLRGRSRRRSTRAPSSSPWRPASSASWASTCCRAPIDPTPRWSRNAVSLPATLLVAARIVHHARRLCNERGWEAVPSGRWLVETSEPLTSEQLATARDIAAGAGLTIESRDQQTGSDGAAHGSHRRRHAARARRPRHDRRPDSQRGRRRPAHPHRDRRDQRHPPHAHRRHRRRARPARRRARHRRRLPRARRPGTAATSAT